MALPRIDVHPVHDFSASGAAGHILIVIPGNADLPIGLPARAQWLAVLKRKDMQPAELAKTPLAIDLPDGQRLALLMSDATLSRFEQLTRLRQAMMLVLEESPKTLALWEIGRASCRERVLVAV